ncbi:MAG: 50S ribosomal protein L10 [Actinomycetota bacterium]
MPSVEKKEKVKQIKKWFDKSDSFLVLRYRGLRVAEANEFRGMVVQNGAQMRVLKNTLTRIALEGTDKEGLISVIDGPVAIIFAGEEPAGVARLVKDYSRGRQEFFLLGGMISGRVLDGKQVETYATLPPRDVLLSQLLGSVAAPLSGLVGVAAGPIRKLLYLMRAVADTKPAEAPAPVKEEPAVAEAAKAEALTEAEAEKAEEIAEAEEAKVEEAAEEAAAEPEPPEGPAVATASEEAVEPQENDGPRGPEDNDNQES